jgi:hypothetical protein
MNMKPKVVRKGDTQGLAENTSSPKRLQDLP